MPYNVSGTIDAPLHYPSHFNFNLDPSVTTDDSAVKAANVLTSSRLLHWPVKSFTVTASGESGTRIILNYPPKNKNSSHVH